ncbi:MAG: class I mannose-6-phosphate isomerase [Clostridiales bacterium]|nr:class I mannose-6-phosphate isomerase [Clostridiales bacterium]
MKKKYPMLIEPVLKDYIWGGVKLVEKWGKPLPGGFGCAAESWELSLRGDAPSRVLNGEFKGQTLYEVLEFNPEFAGKKCLSFPRFPTLIKLIDAKQNLSVQVHPSDRYALANEKSYGKSEVWFILDAEKDAGIFFGFCRDTSRAEVLRRIGENTLTEILNFVPVAKGDVYMIEAGTVHAIGAGITLAEIQQNSDLTYRVYDFGRVGRDGKPRELHVQKALAVMNFKGGKATPAAFPYVDYFGFKKRLIADDKYFFSEFYRIDGSCPLFNEDCFIAVTAAEGRAELVCGGEKTALQKGATAFIPAGLEITVKGEAEFITTTLR